MADSQNEPLADKQVDRQYGSMRAKHGLEHASANGYVGEWFFLREQRFLLSRLDPGLTLDAACGSALMLRGAKNITAIGLDFNAIACEQALKNQQVVARGDAFAMPFADETFDSIINCQFLNQQNKNQRQQFIKEAHRVLKHGGHCHIMWRGAETLVHRLVNFASNTLRRLNSEPVFPQFYHAPAELLAEATVLGFKLVERDMTVPIGPVRVTPDTILAKVFGASHYVKLVKTR